MRSKRGTRRIGRRRDAPAGAEAEPEVAPATEGGPAPSAGPDPTSAAAPASAVRAPNLGGRKELARQLSTRTTEGRKIREDVPYEDHAIYTCECGYVFEADVSTSVGCPYCGRYQAW